MSYQTTYQQWVNEESLDKELRDELDSIANNNEQLHDAFSQPLEFGTAGMRGILGPGINRMNIYTVRQATEGLARFIESQPETEKSSGVAIAYDSRHKSPEFALEAAKTLAEHGIRSYLFESLRPTPELSFAVRTLNTFAGIMITASHNPANYNGYKIYGASGGQMPPKDADTLTRYVRSIENPLQIKVLAEKEARAKGLLTIIGKEIDDAYLKEVDGVTINRELIANHGKDLKLIFTPLHGTGKMLGEKALQQAGFDRFSLVAEQSTVDPDFSTVKSPNPEEYSAFEYAIALGKEENADLLVATDPDADRLGVAVKLPDQSYQVLSGNQIGALMLDYLLKAHKAAGTLPTNAVVLKSIVSSELPTAIAEKYQVKMVNVLTGFKFIAEKIQQYQVDGSQTFMFGFEESFGYLVKPFVRDKDAIQALVLIAEVAAFYKQQGKTLYDALQNIFETFGYYQEKTISITMSGLAGSEKIASLMRQLREKAPVAFGAVNVVSREDYKTQEKVNPDGTVEALNTSPSDVVKYFLADGSWIAARPSGTEPKIKFYIGVKAENKEEAVKKVATYTASIAEMTKVVD